MSWKGSAQEEHYSLGEVQDSRREVKLVLGHSQASMMNTMRGMMAEFTRNNGRSESDSAEGCNVVGLILRRTVSTAVKNIPADVIGMARDMLAEQEQKWGACPGGELSGGLDLPLSRHFTFKHTLGFCGLFTGVERLVDGPEAQGRQTYIAQVYLTEAAVGCSPYAVCLANDGGQIEPLWTPQ